MDWRLQKPEAQSEPSEWTTRCPGGGVIGMALDKPLQLSEFGGIIYNMKASRCLLKRVISGFKWNHWAEILCKGKLLCVDRWLWWESSGKWLITELKFQSLGLRKIKTVSQVSSPVKWISHVVSASSGTFSEEHSPDHGWSLEGLSWHQSSTSDSPCHPWAHFPSRKYLSKSVRANCQVAQGRTNISLCLSLHSMWWCEIQKPPRTATGMWQYCVTRVARSFYFFGGATFVTWSKILRKGGKRNTQKGSKWV